MTHSNVETVLFRVKPGISSHQIETSNDSVNQWLKSQDGFIYRSLSHDPQKDMWIDTVYWRNGEDARKAGDAFMTASETAEYMGMIDEGSVTIYHSDIHVDLPYCD
ncbi:hypothetical protein NF212_20355 [Parasalinivibrio latis]|uniref:hypothetical protein n=1 Tax=Parasalinivibrio latis TaxID=2952610 RepID=UPI0030E59BAE